MIKVTRISTNFAKIPTGNIDETREAFMERLSLRQSTDDSTIAICDETGEAFKIEDRIEVETRAALYQRFESSYVTFEVFQRETIVDMWGRTIEVEVIALLNGKSAGSVFGENFDKAKGNAWRLLCEKYHMDLQTGAPLPQGDKVNE